MNHLTERMTGHGKLLARRLRKADRQARLKRLLTDCADWRIVLIAAAAIVLIILAGR